MPPFVFISLVFVILFVASAIDNTPFLLFATSVLASDHVLRSVDIFVLRSILFSDVRFDFAPRFIFAI